MNPSLFVVTIVVISVIFLIMFLREFVKEKCKEAIPTAIKDVVKKAVFEKIKRSNPNIKFARASELVDKYSSGITNCLLVKQFPSLSELIDVASAKDKNTSPCIRSALNLVVMKYWAEELISNTEENFLQTMECINNLPLNENTLTRFTIRAAECAGERNPLIPDIFGAAKSLT